MKKNVVLDKYGISIISLCFSDFIIIAIVDAFGLE